jgi:hypothetical protein
VLTLIQRPFTGEHTLHYLNSILATAGAILRQNVLLCAPDNEAVTRMLSTVVSEKQMLEKEANVLNSHDIIYFSTLSKTLKKLEEAQLEDGNACDIRFHILAKLKEDS